MTRRPSTVAFLTLTLMLITLSGALSRAVAPPPGQSAAPARSPRVERGAYLVRIMFCNDCHTPWQMGPRGPEPDMTRTLSGHPSDVVMPPPPELPPGPWAWMGAATNTAFAGPWGVSFAANLTPDPDTGLGGWTEEMFLTTIRTGRHQGKGRPILPPMPVKMLADATDDDLKAIFAYIQSLPPVRNRVPAPVDPVEKPER